MVRAYINGHECVFKNGAWQLPANVEKCPRCGRMNKMNTPDGCIGLLPGVVSACCGHGVEEGYIIFENGVELRGIFRVVRK